MHSHTQLGFGSSWASSSLSEAARGVMGGCAMACIA
eukprot:CAMPEP_0206261826 /NCGR_PEP_ID=MMETSP0047_2-20121206/27878_1 /ASSEMBLY_ACC=CAM_ASM_000192 /TAXON_ID=195065 /ORGANISM="Chroomonas mesostigmatica_cf, Strain CCMP1168" /LENGTH=35 /DNA_ID= /DNA_START= /DNA_END= /DNA_ORIENTATION=